MSSIRKTGKDKLANNTSAAAEPSKEMLQLQNEKQSLEIQLLKNENERLKMEKDFMEREHKYQMTINGLMNKVNASATGFGTYGLLARANIRENDELRENLKKVEDRVVPSLESLPKKENYAVCYEYTHGNDKRVRITRNQMQEIEVRDNIAKQYRENPTKRFKPAYEKRYGWLRNADKFLEVKCPNAVSLWIKIRELYPHICYGFRFCNSHRTEIEFLSEVELRAKYQKDKIVATKEAPNKKEQKQAAVFEKLNLKDEDDAVDKCLTSSTEVRDKFLNIINTTIENLKNESRPATTPVRENNHQFKAEEIINFVSNYTFNFNNIINIYNDDRSVEEQRRSSDRLSNR